MLGMPPRPIHTRTEKMNLRPSVVLFCNLLLSSCALRPGPNADASRDFADFPKPPVKSLPPGWATGDEIQAGWTTNLNAILGSLPDTAAKVTFWEDEVALGPGKKYPLQRAKIALIVPTRLNTQTVELRFVNVDYIYSTGLHTADHFILNEVSKIIEISTTGYPRISAEDILRNKVLLVYGTPSGFDGVSHEYQDEKTTMAVRVLDKKSLVIHLRSVEVESALNEALYKVYSEEGLELKKQEILKGFDL